MSAYLKLMKVQSELKAPKSQYSKFGNYHFRSCEDILEAAKPILLENKSLIIIEDDIEHIEGRYYVKSTAIFIDAETGEKVEIVSSAREPENKKGFDESQITGAASSYARKYALNGLLAIDDTKDADATKDAEKNYNKPNTTNPTTPKKPEQTKSALTDKQIKRLYTIAKIAKKTEEDVKKWIKVKWNKESTKDLTRPEYDEICAALEIKKEGNKVKNGDFAIFYIKEGKLYPVAITQEQNQMLQIMIPATLGEKIQVLDKSQGELINLKGETK